MTKDLIDAIRERRSVRNFKSNPIPDPTIGRILECGKLAPSAGNIEPWFFYVVKNAKLKHQLAQFSEPWIDQAPVIIIVAVDYSEDVKRYGEKGRSIYVLQDSAAATQNMLLAACGFGLGSCWVGDFDEEEVRRILEMPENHHPTVLIPVGYPEKENTETIPRKSLDDMVKILH